jgi:hypothetical protein
MKAFSVLIGIFLCWGCTPYDPFELTSGDLTVEEALGYQEENGPYMAIDAESKFITFNGDFFDTIYDGEQYGANGNGDTAVNPGETVRCRIRAANYGKQPALGVHVNIVTNDEYVSDLQNSNGDLGHFPERDRYAPTGKNFFAYNPSEKNLLFTVSPSTPRGHKIKFLVLFTDSSGRYWNDYFIIVVQ